MSATKIVAADGETRAAAVRVLITGGDSFVGRNLTRTLLASGFEVAVTARSMPPLRRVELENSGVEIAIGDLLDSNTLETLRTRPSVIIHAAARSTPYQGAFGGFLNDNILVTRNLVSFAKRVSCTHLIGLSTVSVHGDVSTPNLSHDGGFVNPSPYGLSKRVGELLMTDVEASMRVSVVRLPSVIGLGAHRHWLAQVVARGIRGQVLEISGPLNLFNNTVHVDDLCNFLARISILTDPERMCFPLASAHPITIEDVLKIVLDHTGNRSQILEIERVGESFVIDDSLARQSLGYTSASTEGAITNYVKAEVEASGVPVDFGP
jgi:nucleoside-diphosphate-sugar epimerase